MQRKTQPLFRQEPSRGAAFASGSGGGIPRAVRRRQAPPVDARHRRNVSSLLPLGAAAKGSEQSSDRFRYPVSQSRVTFRVSSSAERSVERKKNRPDCSH